MKKKIRRWKSGENNHDFRFCFHFLFSPPPIYQNIIHPTPRGGGGSAAQAKEQDQEYTRIDNIDIDQDKAGKEGSYKGQKPEKDIYVFGWNILKTELNILIKQRRYFMLYRTINNYCYMVLLKQT